MIWFFLMGMIAGAIGMIMLAHWWILKNAKVVRIPKDEEQTEDNDE